MSSVLRRDLRNSTAEGMAASVMVGIGETYLPVFVLALSGSELACGLVTTVPLMIGAVVQLGSPWLMRKCGSYRRWVSLCVFVQAIAFVPLIAAAVMGRMSLGLVFALVAVYWATGLGSSGPWNAWMETLVPPPVRARYFAWRSRICQWGVALGFVGGGIALQWAAGRGSPLAVFGLLFFVAAAGRLTSAGLLATQRDPQPFRGSCSRLSLTTIFSALTDGRNGRLLLYLMAAQAAVQIAGPYFNPYMLGELHFSYSTYAIVVCDLHCSKDCLLTDGRPNCRSRGSSPGVLDQRRGDRADAGSVARVAQLRVSDRGTSLFGDGLVPRSTLPRCCCFSKPFHGRSGSKFWPFSTWRTLRPSSAVRCWERAFSPCWGPTPRAYGLLFGLSAVARAAAIVLLIRLPAGTVLREVRRVIPMPHYLRPAVRGTKAQEELAGSSRV